MMPGWMMTGWGMGHGLFGWLMMLLFWILIIGGIAWLVWWFMNQPKHSQTEENALEILKKRYARGEIDKEQFENMRRDLT
jgi:putative membrane protein